MKATILVAEDEPDTLRVVVDYLRYATEDYHILQAKNGQIALRIIEKQQPNLILTDWNMPVMTGLELTRILKSRDDLRHIPIIMQTANTKDEELKIAFDAGVIDYIKKPIDGSVELLSRIKSALELTQAKRKNEELLLKIFPQEVVEELREEDHATSRYFKSASILFADIKGFSITARRLKDEPQTLVKMLENCFDCLDDIAIKYDVERIKTIGDCYMAVAGVPTKTPTHAIDLVLAGLHMQAALKQLNENAGVLDSWQLRMGIHSGDLVAGVIGKMKFAYDVWGDSVNLASRLESTGEVGKVHISEETYKLVKDFFVCQKRPEPIEAKNMGNVHTYFVKGIHPELSSGDTGIQPNEKFEELRKRQKMV